MKKLLTAFGVAALLIGGAGTALADSGSSETDNEVTCGENNDVNDNDVYAGADGIEVCNDDEAPLDGRILINGSGVTADGDNDNGDTTGWIRVGPGGVKCGEGDSTAEEGTDCEVAPPA